MVVSLGPGKFYGSSLPRPWFYSNVRYNSERVDPPVPVLDPLLSWASEAHWSMGGLSFNRLRLQGRIEGNVERLRAQIEKQAKLSMSPKVEVAKGSSGKKRAAASPSPPPAPIAAKRRRRYMAVVDEDDESEEEEVEEKVVVDDDEDEDDDSNEEESNDEEEEEPVQVVNKKKKPARKLYEEFNRVADKRRSEGGNGAGGNEVKKVVAELNMEHSETGEAKGSPKKGRKIGPGSGVGGGTRTSPRLAKASETGPSPRTRSSRRLVKRG